PSIPNTENPHLYDAELYARAAIQYARLDEEYRRTRKLPPVPPIADTTQTSSRVADVTEAGNGAGPCVLPPASERILDNPVAWLFDSRSLQSHPAHYTASHASKDWAEIYCSSEFPMPADQSRPASSDAWSDAQSDISYAPSECSTDEDDDGASMHSDETYASDLSDCSSEYFVDEDELEDLKIEALKAAEDGLSATAEALPLPTPSCMPDSASSSSPLPSPASPSSPPASPTTHGGPVPVPPETTPSSPNARARRRKRKKGPDRAFEPFLSWQYREPPTTEKAQELRDYIMHTHL
ncbi:hypothetical protein K523DRAFT_222201, partial [Schizophyllum commune Tattone D]